MFDEMEEPTLARGLRYKGPRIPSQILDAMMDDLIKAADQGIEYGYEQFSAYQPIVVAQAMIALCNSDPDFDKPMPDRWDGNEYDNYTMEELTLYNMVDNLIDFLDGFTAEYLRYEWCSSDPEDEDFDELGVWIDWNRIRDTIEAGKMHVLDIEDEIENEELRNDLSERGVRYAIYWDSETASLWETAQGTRIW